MTQYCEVFDKDTQLLDKDGTVIAGAKLYVYTSRTTDLATVYQDGAGTAQTNPVIADTNGRPQLYVPQGVFYNIAVHDSNDKPLYTLESIFGSAFSSTPIFTGTITPAMLVNGTPHTMLGTDGSGNLQSTTTGSNLTFYNNVLSYSGTPKPDSSVFELFETFTSQTKVIITAPYIDPAYKHYDFFLYNVTVSGGGNLILETSTDGGITSADGAGFYDLSAYTNDGPATASNTSTTRAFSTSNQHGMRILTSPGINLNYDMSTTSGGVSRPIGSSTKAYLNYFRGTIYDLTNAAAKTTVIWKGCYDGSSQFQYIKGFGQRTIAEAENAIILKGSGVISGTILWKARKEVPGAF
jgi:hypothetical protein